MERIRPVGPGERGHARHVGELVERVRPLAQHHQELSVRSVLDDEVRALVDRPDVVVLVDAHGVREAVAVAPLAELLDEIPRLVELEDAGLAAAHEDEHVALGIGGHADALAHVEAVGEAVEVGDGVVRNLACGRPGLGRSSGIEASDRAGGLAGGLGGRGAGAGLGAWARAGAAPNSSAMTAGANERLIISSSGHLRTGGKPEIHRFASIEPSTCDQWAGAPNMAVSSALCSRAGRDM